MADHDRIWLSPRCETCAGEERTWCWENMWSEGCDPPNCTAMPTEYVRADLAVTLADRDTLRARVAELEGAMREIITDASVPQQDYDKNGPTWTGKGGHEYADMSHLLGKCDELADIARTALKGANVNGS